MKNDAMTVDLPGKIGNTKLPYSNCLFPLFEAIINAVHAIQDRQKEKKEGGRIDITIDRSPQQSLIPTSGAPEIIGFTIVDDGIGFTDRNYQSFRTSDSTYKQQRGGKGLGRMLWLKAFNRAEIESVFQENDKYWTRSFGFALTQSGVVKHTKKETEKAPSKTMVKLLGYKRPYQHAAPKTAAPIAKRIIEHCLEFFALKTAPTIVLHDLDGEEINLNKEFDEDFHISSERRDFTVNDMPFSILHVMVKASGDAEHLLHFCADSRTVRSINGAKTICNIETPLHNEGQPFVYAGYVSGQYLNDRAINERTQFAISDSDDHNLFSDEEISWPEIIGGTAKEAEAFLQQFTAPVKERKMERIRKFVMEEASQYRPLLKHKIDKLDKIPAQILDDKLDIELYKIDQEYDAELRERCAELLAEGDPKALELEEHRVEMEKFTEEWNEHGMGKLARHVAYRKATLRFLYSRLHQQSSGKYSLEESMHEVIFPLRTTSDDVRADQMNLWILDEKLAVPLLPCIRDTLRSDESGNGCR
ncbi:MAG: ATP-binding protein [Planctomycetota bacterium]